MILFLKRKAVILSLLPLEKGKKGFVDTEFYVSDQRKKNEVSKLSVVCNISSEDYLLKVFNINSAIYIKIICFKIPNMAAC